MALICSLTETMLPPPGGLAEALSRAAGAAENAEKAMRNSMDLARKPLIGADRACLVQIYQLVSVQNLRTLDLHRSCAAQIYCDFIEENQ